MSGVKLKLFHYPKSGPSRGALLVARQLGLQLDIQEVDLFKKEQFQNDFIQINPQHTVPTLVDGDFVLWDGHAIATYLVDSYGQDDSLYPRDAKKRAIVDHRLFFDVGVLYARLRVIHYPALHYGKTEVTEDELKNLDEAVGWVEMFLSKDDWVAGPSLTIADTSFLATISTMVAIGYKIKRYPRICDWLQRCEKHIKGWAENQIGAEEFGQRVRSKLKPNQFK